VLVLARHREIIAQTAKQLDDLGITCRIIQAGSPYEPLLSVQVASNKTLVGKGDSKQSHRRS
jgi:hypothetical protein